MWEQLPLAVKRFIAEHNRNQRDNSTNNAPTNSNRNTSRGQTRRNNKVRFTEPSDDEDEEEEESQSSNESEQSDDDNNDEQPSLQSILRSKSTKTWRSGKTTKRKGQRVNPLLTKTSAELTMKKDKTNEELALVDSGTDTTCLGPAFRIIATTDRTANLVGFDDDMIKEDLYIGDGITLATTENGEKVLLRFNEGIIHQKGKSIFSIDQMRSFGIQVNDTAKVYDGKQNLVTHEDEVLPLT